ncbi:MAG TPA: methylated-DNA--[protein]-cysteine S-methyltransferase [Solirubrobacteraceae bacterium]|jgi:methylated-DNA-[protein]-cysteine S-methyltransferase
MRALRDPGALQYTTCDSPLGELLLLGDEDALHGLHMQDGPRPKLLAPAWERTAAPFRRALQQLDEYFDGKRVSFGLALAMGGTPFERQVWNELQAIPYGATVSYGELARRIGRPTGPRAVGLANGRNPISVIVPCHRVIGANGSLTGYGGGLQRKRALLELERRHARG